MLVLVVTDVIEDEEFEFRAPVGSVCETGGLEVRFRLLGDSSRIAGVGISGHRVDDVAEDAEGRHFASGIDARGSGVRNEDHVGFLDLLEATDAGAIEADAVHPDRPLQVIEVDHVLGRDREVLPEAGQVGELEVNDLEVVLLDQIGDLLNVCCGCQLSLLRSFLRLRLYACIPADGRCVRYGCVTRQDPGDRSQ